MNLTITLDSELMDRARAAARTMPETETWAAVSANLEDERRPASMRVSRTDDGLLVLGTFKENEQTFYFGTPLLT